MNSIVRVLEKGSVDILRIAVGLSLLFVAVSFIMEKQMLEGLLWSGPLPFVSFMACHVIIASLLAGGTLLTVGFGTRIASLIQLPIVVGALAAFIFADQVPEALTSLYLSPILLMGLLSLLVMGPGTYSIDSLIGLDAEQLKDNNTFDPDMPVEADPQIQSANLTFGECEIELARRLAA